jgi:hypothetical protein
MLFPTLSRQIWQSTDIVYDGVAFRLVPLSGSARAAARREFYDAFS